MAEPFVDVESLKRVFRTSDSQEKLRLLRAVDDHMGCWDIHPIHTLVAGLLDVDSEVRIETLQVLLNSPQELPRFAVSAVLKLVADPAATVRAALLEHLPMVAFLIDREDVSLILPFLRHKNQHVRDAAIQILEWVPEHLNEPHIVTQLIDACRSEHGAVRHSLAELLISIGQGDLVEP